MHSSRMCTSRSSSRLMAWGRGCLPQCMLGYPPSPQVWAWRPPRCGLETPQVWAWKPLRVWAWRPPPCQTPQLPPWCGPGNPPSPGQTPQLPQWVWAWRPAMHAEIPSPRGQKPAMHAGIPPPCEQND